MVTEVYRLNLFVCFRCSVIQAIHIRENSAFNEFKLEMPASTCLTCLARHMHPDDFIKSPFFIYEECLNFLHMVTILIMTVFFKIAAHFKSWSFTTNPQFVVDEHDNGKFRIGKVAQVFWSQRQMPINKSSHFGWFLEWIDEIWKSGGSPWWRGHGFTPIGWLCVLCTGRCGNCPDLTIWTPTVIIYFRITINCLIWDQTFTITLIKQTCHHHIYLACLPITWFNHFSLIKWLCKINYLF